MAGAVAVGGGRRPGPGPVPDDELEANAIQTDADSESTPALSTLATPLRPEVLEDLSAFLRSVHVRRIAAYKALWQVRPQARLDHEIYEAVWWV